MDYAVGDRYVVAWSVTRLIKIVNLTAHEKELLVMILLEDPARKLVSNPIRDLIVHGVSTGIPGFELWEVASSLDEDQLIAEFTETPETIKQEIRESGKLIYTVYQ